MKATILFRICAVLFVFFAVGHTFGFLSFRPPTPDGLAVLDAMQRVHFTVGHSSYSYGGFYRGFGLSITLTNLYCAVLCWWFGSLAKSHPEDIALPGWSFLALQLGGLVLAMIYFGPGPVLLSALLILCLAWAIVESGRNAKSVRSA